MVKIINILTIIPLFEIYYYVVYGHNVRKWICMVLLFFY